jgi:hypothetical protein
MVMLGLDLLQTMQKLKMVIMLKMAIYVPGICFPIRPAPTSTAKDGWAVVVQGFQIAIELFVLRQIVIQPAEVYCHSMHEFG